MRQLLREKFARQDAKFLDIPQVWQIFTENLH